MESLLAQLSSDIYSKKILPASSKFFCAISGGQDSQLLFYILLHFKQYCPLNFNVVYMHHFWQLSNFYSFREISKLCILFQIPFISILTEKNLKTEDEARNWRTKNFFSLTTFNDFPIILLAQTTSDYIETAIWNLIRGTSPKGLTSFRLKKTISDSTSNLYFLRKENLKKKRIRFKSQLKIRNQHQQFNSKKIFNKKLLIRKTSKLIIYQKLDDINHFLGKNQRRIYLKQNCYKLQTKRKIRILLPLFDYYRQDITNLIQKLNLPFNPDPTNKNYTFTRNKIRTSLLLHWRQTFNYSIDENISNFLTINLIEQKFLEDLILKIIQEHFSIQIFKKLPNSIQKKILHLLCERYTGRQLNSRTLKLIYFFILNCK